MLKILQWEHKIRKLDGTFIYPYYIILSRDDIIYMGPGIAFDLNMNYTEYKKMLMGKFRVYCYEERIFFYTEEDAELALELIESIYLTIKLAQ